MVEDWDSCCQNTTVDRCGHALEIAHGDSGLNIEIWLERNDGCSRMPINLLLANLGIPIVECEFPVKGYLTCVITLLLWNSVRSVSVSNALASSSVWRIAKRVFRGVAHPYREELSACES